MADWLTLQHELPPLVGGLLELPCDWRKQPRPMHLGARAELDIIAEAALGVDDRAWDEQPDETIQARVTGQRVFTLQVTAWSCVHSIEQSARRYLEQLRIRLRLPSVLEHLDQLELALVDTMTIVQLDPAEDGRVVSQASLDVRLAYALSETDAPIPTIAHAEVRGRFPRLMQIMVAEEMRP